MLVSACTGEYAMSKEHGSPMTEAQPLVALQQRVDAWAHQHWDGAYWPPLANLARLTEETGEVARAINQAYGPKRLKTEETQASIAIELADALFAILCLANSTDVDLQAAFDTMMEQYGVREARQ
jgi:NTP pyrophosphatase (non-canonical NTP hydrolase)